MGELVRLTQHDYREFRRAYSKIVYSFSKPGMGDPVAEALACKIATETQLRKKGEFLDDLETPGREMYFYVIDGINQGYMEVIFKENKVCDIFEFAVFEHCKGYGSDLWEQTYKLIKERGMRKIHLWCPYEGAQIFWQKMGFTPFYSKQRLYYRKKVR